MSVFGKEISEDAICIFASGTSKFDALDGMIEAICKTDVVMDKEALRRALFEREAIRSTGFRGVAIPHVRIDEVTHPTVGVGISKGGVDFEALDNEPVNIIILFAMPSGSDKEYLGVLAQVMMVLRSDAFCKKLIACDSADKVINVLNKGA